MRIDGYALDNTDGSCCVFISDYRDVFESDAIRADDIRNHFRKMRYFVEESINTNLYKEMEESTEAYEFSRMLHDNIEDITKFRFFLLTDAYNRQRSKTMKDDEVAGRKAELNVWDITRIFDLVSSKRQKESVEISFDDFGIDGIPCVKAVEYEDVKADIEVPLKYDENGNRLEEESDENMITYSSYLAVIPGRILSDLYLEYGSRLLEGNVRSFLSARGKVNKAIQSTIKNYPEMFFAYNNGIAATASDVETEMTDEGLFLTKITDLQIVNGGQTTASIAYTMLNLRKDETVNIDSLFVPMKISVLEHSMSEKIIPKISEYSNSQNPVAASDFFSNHPFHIRMEEYSRKTPIPAVHGNQFQQYWFYERSRGQYDQGKMKFRPKSSQMRQYELRYPKNQVIKMIDLAKYMEIFYGEPAIVSKGKQSIIKAFSPLIKEQWAKSDVDFNPYYYKRVVSLAIIFRETDNIIKQTYWYKEKHSYKANVIAYTMSVIFNYIDKKCPGREFNFQRIWDQQDIYLEHQKQMEVLCIEVYRFITREDRLVENVTEWCKRDACWKRAQEVKWSILPEFINTLVSKEKNAELKKDAEDTRKINNEVDDLSYIINMGSDYWRKVFEWGTKRNLLNDMEQSILKITMSIDKTGRIPTAKQAKVVLKARKKMIEEGMPLQF